MNWCCLLMVGVYWWIGCGCVVFVRKFWLWMIGWRMWCFLMRCVSSFVMIWYFLIVFVNIIVLSCRCIWNIGGVCLIVFGRVFWCCFMVFMISSIIMLWCWLSFSRRSWIVSSWVVCWFVMLIVFFEKYCLLDVVYLVGLCVFYVVCVV